MIRKVLMVLILIFVFSNTAWSQSLTENMKSDSGICYGYCKLPPVYRFDTLLVLKQPKQKKLIHTPITYDVTSDTILIPVYDSIQKIEPGVYDVQFKMTAVQTTTGEQYKFTYRELSVISDPDTFNLQKPPKIFFANQFIENDKAGEKKILIPAQYELVIEKNVVNSAKDYGYVDILCADELTHELIKNLKQILFLHGLAVDSNNTEWNDTDEEQLIKYQTDNELPVGHFNIPTLQQMGLY